MENSWILLSIIFILLISLLIYENRKRKNSNNQLSINEKFIINNKDRIAQIILMPILKIDFEEVDNLPETVRGSGGFGSTGK